MTRTARVFALTLFAAFAATRVHRLYDTDLPWHLHNARQVLTHGALSNPETGAFSMGQRPFLSHEWLAELGLYALHHLGGSALLCWLPAAAALAAAWWLFRLARDEAPEADVSTWVFAPLVALAAAASRFQPRPHLTDLVGVPFALWLTRAYALESRPARATRLALALAVTQLLWAQMHSSFVLVLPLFLISLTQARWSPDARPRHLALTLALGLATLSNPLGLAAFGNIGAHVDSESTRRIVEMQPGSWATLDPARSDGALWAWAALGIVFAGATVGVRPRRDDLLRAALALALAASARRFLGLAVMLNVPWLVASVAGLQRGALWPWRLGAALLPLAAYHRFASATPMERMGVGLNPMILPTASTQAIARLGVTGNLWNDYADGGWLLWHLTPQLRILIDGRTPTYFDAEAYFLARRSAVDPAVFEALRARFDLRHALVSRDSPLCRTLRDDPAWAARYADAQRVYFVRADAAPGPRLDLFARCELRFAQLSEALPPRCDAARAELATLRALTPEAEHLTLFEAITRSACGRPEAATPLLRALCAESRTPALVTEAAWVALARGELALARRCADRAEGAHPDGNWHALRGALAAREGRHAEAVAHFDRALAEYRDGAPAGLRLDYAESLLALGRRDEALAQAWRAELLGSAPARRWRLRH